MFTTAFLRSSAGEVTRATHNPLTCPTDGDEQPFSKTRLTNSEPLTPDTRTKGTPSGLAYENATSVILNEEVEETLIRGETKVGTATSKLTPDILVGRLELTLKVA
jgi:hypothetical protein